MVTGKDTTAIYLSLNVPDFCSENPQIVLLCSGDWNNMLYTS